MTSVVGATGNPGQANYAASKAGIVGMSKALAQEVGAGKEKVGCWIESGMTSMGRTDRIQAYRLAQVNQAVPT